MSRIIPRDRDPGAREAATVAFVDRYLSGIEYIYAKPDGSGFLALHGRTADVWRRRIERLQGKYVEGVITLDFRSQERFGRDFAELAETQQDEILELLASPEQATGIEAAGTVSGFNEPQASMQQMIDEHQLEFFPLLVLHTRQGFYADPVYGGNKEHVGWKTIGFPGPRSMAEVHNGRYSTLAYFAHQSPSGDERGTS